MIYKVSEIKFIGESMTNAIINRYFQLFLFIIKNQRMEHSLIWRILDHTKKYNNGSKYCSLCGTEKYRILEGITTKKHFLNKKTEIFNLCPHRKRNFFKNIS